MIGIALGALTLAIWVYLVAFRGGFWRIEHDAAPLSTPPARRIVAVIPARDEAEVIGPAVASLLTQRCEPAPHVILVDDGSSDGTAAIAREAAEATGAAERLTVVTGQPLPSGWTGKLWAIRQGIAAAQDHAPDYLLLTDADIVHAPDNVSGLAARAEQGGFDLVSLMVRLYCQSWSERLLIPAFVFFFFKLYPPRWVADPARRTAAAAGGCMLIRNSALQRIGGVEAIRHEIIDDCALARRIKAAGRIWLGASHDTRSIREYGSWRAIWDMIARCAFAQLGYSAVLLVLTVAAMAVVYLAPVVLLFSGSLAAALLGAAAWALMSAAFVPVLRLYDCPLLLAPLLPLIALFYSAATIASAVQYWSGRGGRWKGRYQAAAAE